MYDERNSFWLSTCLCRLLHSCWKINNNFIKNVPIAYRQHRCLKVSLQILYWTTERYMWICFFLLKKKMYKRPKEVSFVLPWLFSLQGGHSRILWKFIPGVTQEEGWRVWGNRNAFLHMQFLALAVITSNSISVHSALLLCPCLSQTAAGFRGL